MILLLALSAAATAVPPSVIVLDGQAPTARCPIMQTQNAQAKKPLPRAHALSEEPTARQEIAVLAKDADGCIKPIIVREDVGG